MISSADSTLSRAHSPCESSGINSMKRISMPVFAAEARQRNNIGLHQVLHRHCVNLDRPEPDRCAVSIPSSTLPKSSRRVIFRKRSRSSVSKCTFSRRNPASYSA